MQSAEHDAWKIVSASQRVVITVVIIVAVVSIITVSYCLNTSKVLGSIQSELEVAAQRNLFCSQYLASPASFGRKLILRPAIL